MEFRNCEIKELEWNNRPNYEYELFIGKFHKWFDGLEILKGINETPAQFAIVEMIDGTVRQISLSRFSVKFLSKIELPTSDDFDIEEELIKREFVLDCEKDERTTYLRGYTSVTLHWTGEMLDEDGYCISMTIEDIGSRSLLQGKAKEPIYFGARPTTKSEFDKLFDSLD